MSEEMNSQMTDVISLERGSIVKGKITKLEDNQAFVDVGYKFDGVIPIGELSSLHVEKVSDVVAVGDEIELKVLRLNEEEEKLILSKRAIDAEKAWDELQAKFDSGEVFEAKIADVVKGGLVVDLGVRGFIPASLVERHFVEDFSDYKGRTLRLKVVELDQAANKVILSQKAVLDAEFEDKKKTILDSIQPGQLIEGTVQRLTDFGAFVDVGGIDGLVHVSELAWHHVEKPADFVKEGDKVKVKVLKVDPENERISLSMKAAQPGPWDTVSEKVKAGDVLTGTVKRLVTFGAFVEVAPGVEGLVHISQISHRHIATPGEVLKEGEEVKVKVLDVNPAEKRVSLSIKEMEEAPAAPAPTPRRSGKAERDIEIPANTGMGLTLGDVIGEQLKKLK
jgi:small subunit ribosomal protein S1